MKLKKAAVLALTIMLAVVPTFTFAYRSKDYSGSSTTVSRPTTTVVSTVGTGSAGTSVPTKDTKVQVSSTGAMVSTTGSTIDKTGTEIQLVVNTKTTEGKNVVSNNQGGVTIDTLGIHFADGIAETAGLPVDVVGKIDKLNQGGTVKDILGADTGVDLTGYEKLGNTRAVIVYDSTTKLTHTATDLIIHMNLKPGMALAAVYYDNNTGRWVYVPVTADFASNTLVVRVPGSCTLQLIQKLAAN